MPGIFVARPAGGHLKEVPFAHQQAWRKLMERWRLFPSLQWWGPLGKSGPAAPRLFATQLWSASGTEKHPSSSPPFAFASLLRAAGCRPSVDVRRFAPILRTVARPGPAADFDTEAKLTRCPYITNISGSARTLQGSPEGHVMFWLFVGRAAQTGAGMGAISSRIWTSTPGPPRRRVA